MCEYNKTSNNRHDSFSYSIYMGTCRACKGSGVLENKFGEFKVCPLCHGTGVEHSPNESPIIWTHYGSFPYLVCEGDPSY